MANSIPARADEPAESALAGRLDGWKAIATYLGRDVRTVNRWEADEGLPVHRHVHRKRGTVYAYGPELEDWSKRRSSRQRLLPGRRVMLAVLPFANLSDRAGDDDYLSDGLTEEYWPSLAGSIPRSWASSPARR